MKKEIQGNKSTKRDYSVERVGTSVISPVIWRSKCRKIVRISTSSLSHSIDCWIICLPKYDLLRLPSQQRFIQVTLFKKVTKVYANVRTHRLAV